MTRRREYLLATLAFSGLTIALTYPQITVMSSHVGVHYDALFSVWRLAWVAHQLPRDPSNLFDANIFYPAENALAYSDAVLLQSLLGSPFLWAGANPVVVYNALVLMSFVAAGLGMYAWLAGIGLPPAAAMIGSLTFAFQPYRFAHFPQFELLWTCFVPLAFLALHRVMRTRRGRDGVWLGLAVSLQAWSCLYYAVFLITGLAIVAVVLLIQTRATDWRSLARPTAAALAVALLLCAPYALPYLATRDAREARTIELANWSATPENYLSTTAESWFYRHPAPPPMGPFEGVLFPGFLTLGLAVAGLARAPSPTAAYAVLAIVAFDLSLGVNGWLYEPLRQRVLLYEGLRVPARLFVIVSTALALLAAHGANAALRQRSGLRRRLVAMAVAGIILLETLSVPIPLKPVPEGAKVYHWLRQQPRAAVFEWPAPKTSALGFTRAPEYMFHSIGHWQPLALGYSGNYPAVTLGLLERVASFPAPAALQALQRHGVKYLIVHSRPDSVEPDAVATALASRPEVRFLFADSTASEELTVYEVQPPR